MGLILDTSALIDAERSGTRIGDLATAISRRYGDQDLELSVITIAELTHGIYRAKSFAHSQRRRRFVTDVINGFPIHDVTQPIATFTGRIEGEQAAQGNAIAFQDLVIGATALHLDHSVLTANTRHFAFIPGLTVHTF